MKRSRTTCCLIMVIIMATAIWVVGCASGEVEPISPPVGDDTQRIVGGQTFTGLPAVGALVNNGYMHCSGTLVTPRKVVTAAHCVSGVYASSLSFVIGPSISNAQAVLKVASATPHPSYSSYSLTNDIGLVTLTQDAPVAPMGVVTSMDSSWVGTDLFFVGYGITRGGGYDSGTKRAVWMTIDGVQSTKFSYGGNGLNTCNGDSGGPAFYQDANGQFLVAGVTSYGDQYCTSYGVDTRVDPYLSFLGLSGSSPTPTPADNCNGETYGGRCQGDTVIWCENNQVQSKDCAASGQQCMYDSQNKYYGCSQPADQTDDDGCQGETYEGRCSGSTLIWCEDNQVKTEDCGKYSGTICAWDSAKGFYNCI